MLRLASLCFIFLLFWAESAPAGENPTFGNKALGILLIGADADADWNSMEKDLRSSFGSKVPFETFTGPVATRGIQRALDRLTAGKVEKILVIPFYMDSQSPEVEQIQYILGIKRLPSKTFLESWGMNAKIVPRAKTRIPLVLGKGLDDDPVAAEILLSRALELSRDPGKESLVLIGRGAGEEDINELIQRNLNSLTMRLENKNKFKTVRGILIRPATKTVARQEEKSFAQLTKLIRSLSISSRVILVPHLLTRDGAARAWRKKLDNLFFRWQGKAMLPDPRLTGWVTAQVEKYREEPDMVRFKDKGQALPPPDRKKSVQ